MSKGKKRDDGLTLTGAFLVLNRRGCRLRSVAVPMDGVEIDQLRPRPFLWLRLGKNFLQKIVLLQVNLWTLSH